MITPPQHVDLLAPKPWFVEQLTDAWILKDANGEHLFCDFDEALVRRIAFRVNWGYAERIAKGEVE